MPGTFQHEIKGDNGIVADSVFKHCIGHRVRHTSGCYRYSATAATFGNAIAGCEATGANPQGASLVTISDFAELASIRDLLEELSVSASTAVWVGFTNAESHTLMGGTNTYTGWWRWLSGETSSISLLTSYNNWATTHLEGRSSHFTEEVAQGRPCVQWSTHVEATDEGLLEAAVPGYAVDSDMNTFAQTNPAANNAWWRVDLGDNTFMVHYVIITTPNWVDDFDIYLSNEVTTVSASGSASGSTSGWSTVDSSGIQKQWKCGGITGRPYQVETDFHLTTTETITCHGLGPRAQARYVSVVVPGNSQAVAIANIKVMAVRDGPHESLGSAASCMALEVTNMRFSRRTCTDSLPYVCERK